MASGRSNADGETTAMKVETRYTIHNSLRHEIDREGPVDKPIAKRRECRFSDEQCLGLQSTREETRDYQSAFGHEESEPREQFGIGYVAELRQPIVVLGVDTDGAHAGIVTRSAVAAARGCN